jgi:hypothetical protein
LGSPSPLADVPDVQFARWVVIDGLRTDWPGAPPRPSVLRSDYLLFSADLTPPRYRAARLPGSFFRDLAQFMPVATKRVWEHCLGFPGLRPVEDFVEYLTRSQIEIGLYYAAYPDATPVDIHAALKVREKLTEFAITHQDAIVRSRRSSTHRQELREAYRNESPSWYV